jgi:hypothetical protein
VSDRNPQNLALGGAPGEDRPVIFDPEINMLAKELQVLVPEHGSWQKAELEEDLESIADSQDETPVMGEIFDLLHERGEAGDGARPEVIPVRKTPRQDDAIHVPELMVFVPE